MHSASLGYNKKFGWGFITPDSVEEPSRGRSGGRYRQELPEPAQRKIQEAPKSLPPQGCD